MMCLRCFLFLQPDETVGAGISAHKKSAIDAMWADMNAVSVAPSGGAMSGGLSTGKGKGKNGKKKAVKKANKVTVQARLFVFSALHSCLRGRPM